MEKFTIKELDRRRWTRLETRLRYVAHKLKVSFEFSGAENISDTSHVQLCWL